jgi:hypothetical protein
VADPAPPAPSKKPAGPMRFLLIGCGLVAGMMILGLGSCAGFMVVLYRGTDAVAQVGAEYLRKSPQVQAAFGSPVVVQRHKFGWNVNVTNDRGNARISYDVRGANISTPFNGVVWLVRSAGAWSAVGAEVQGPDGYPITLGKTPMQHPGVDGND